MTRRKRTPLERAARARYAALHGGPGQGSRYAMAAHGCDSCGGVIQVGTVETYRRGFWVHSTCVPGGDDV